MKVNAPEKIYIEVTSDGTRYYRDIVKEQRTENSDIEYTRTDAFIEKARKRFEKQNEWFDPNGNRHCDMEGFEDFKKYMKL